MSIKTCMSLNTISLLVISGVGIVKVMWLRRHLQGDLCPFVMFLSLNVGMMLLALILSSIILVFIYFMSFFYVAKYLKYFIAKHLKKCELKNGAPNYDQLKFRV
jgi:hypothetical protein